MLTDLKSHVQTLATDFLPQLLDWRHHLHANPELSFVEYKTCAFVKAELEKMGIESQILAKTGLVAMIGKPGTKKVVALRADLDALPITELNEVDYKSQNEGVMHACGHDVHTTSLLGAAKILKSVESDLDGQIKLIFQPGEEKAPGGASIMIKEGVLKKPNVKSIFGQHVMPLIDAGKVGFRSGIYMASTDELYFTVKGKGGHGAMPEQNIDPVLITSHIIVALQQIVSRNASPKTPSVLSFGRVEALGATNIIPDEVKVQGTFRTLDEKWRKQAHKLMIKMAESIAEGMGGTCEFTVKNGYPFLTNAPALSNRAKDYAVEYLGAENVQNLDIWMAAEDFAFYSHEVDACFYRLGIRNKEKGITSMVHTPTFDIDESALTVGAGLMAWIAIRELQAQ